MCGNCIDTPCEGKYIFSKPLPMVVPFVIGSPMSINSCLELRRRYCESSYVIYLVDVYLCFQLNMESQAPESNCKELLFDHLLTLKFMSRERNLTLSKPTPNYSFKTLNQCAPHNVFFIFLIYIYINMTEIGLWQQNAVLAVRIDVVTVSFRAFQSCQSWTSLQ